jgi:RNA polymerase subunit RPABC4/transcription elongation factor Spt4
MAIEAFCPTCRRTAYVEPDDTPICPVCSSPLVETVGAEESESD